MSGKTPKFLYKIEVIDYTENEVQIIFWNEDTVLDSGVSVVLNIDFDEFKEMSDWDVDRWVYNSCKEQYKAFVKQLNAWKNKEYAGLLKAAESSYREVDPT